MARREINEIPRIAESPVQEALARLEGILSSSPQPEAPTDGARRCGELLGNHLVSLIRGCGELNSLGQHSAAVCLFRPMEDALDLFAAITAVTGAAERWLEGQLRPSDAAKLWTPTVRFSHAVLGGNLGDYRKALRSFFNPLSHCDYCVAEWDLYADPASEEESARLIVNHGSRHVLELNTFRIDAQLVAHCHEYLAVFRRGYHTHLSKLPQMTGELERLADSIERVLMQSFAQGDLGEMIAPESRGVPLVARGEPATTSVAGEWEGCWQCHGEAFPNAHLNISQKEHFLRGALLVDVRGRGRFRQDVHGLAQGNEVLLDAITVSTDAAVYAPDRLMLHFESDDKLVGIHKCDLGEGPAEFRRKCMSGRERTKAPQGTP